MSCLSNNEGMPTAAQLLSEAERIQRLVGAGQQPVVLRLIGSLAVWHYCQGRVEIPECLDRRPRDIDFVYSAGGASTVVSTLQAAGYDCDMRLVLETQGTRIHAERDQYSVDAFADPISFWQTLRLGERLKLCSPSVSLTDLLLLKLQIQQLEPHDQMDAYALLIRSHEAADACLRLDLDRLEAVLGYSWNWWKAIQGATNSLRSNLAKNVRQTTQHRILEIQISRIAEILEKGRHTIWWRLSRVADSFIPSGNEVDQR